MKRNITSMKSFEHILVLSILFTLIPIHLFSKDYVIISEIMYDSPLNEQTIPGTPSNNGEYIELYNAGENAVNMGGWVLRGGSVNEVITFTSGLVLPAKSYLIVAYQFLNSGFTLDQLFAGFAPAADKQVYYQQKIILSNSGEAVYLRDNLGITKDSVYYDGTSSSTYSIKLRAANPVGAAGNSCISLQRKSFIYITKDKAAFNRSEWTTAGVSLFQQTSNFQPNIPGVVNVSISNSKNYILSITPLDATTNITTNNGEIRCDNDAWCSTSIQYFDGLGRPEQTIQRGITPTGADLVSGIEYDGFGREYRHWLPGAVASNNGAYVSDFGAKATSSNGGDTKPYAETILESSPLSRPLGQHQPGADWYSHPTGIDYQSNDGSISYYYVDNNSLAKGTNYASGSLYVTQVTDEDGNAGYEFKDKLGRVILKRQKLGGDNVDTYYVYNDLNQLCYVLPPKAVDELSSDLSDGNTVMKQYSYLYKYDPRGNCIYKRLPGCEPIYMVYDKADRLILSQDGNQRAKTPAQWTVTKYDVFNRIVYTGLLNSNDSRETLAGLYANTLCTESYTGSGPVAGYTSASLTPASLLSVNYYDSYSFRSLLSTVTQTIINYEILSGYDKAYPTTATTTDQLNAKGLLTGSRTYILDGSGNYNVAAIYYDDKGQVVQSRSTNHLGGYDLAFNVYRFSGVVEKTLKKHKISTSNELTELYTYNYDHAQRPTTTTYSLNGGSPVTLASNTYDDLGRLQSKKRHTNADTESYAYNVRSWPTSIISGGFTENLYYNTNPLNANLSYNGNISYSTWTYKNGSSTVEKAYSYQYDGLNRLKTSEFKQGTSTQASGSFDETFTYDKMGNILTLQRKRNNTTIDNLSFNYTGNQINNISDAGGSQSSYDIKEYQNKSTATTGEFAYDANGNMVKDLDRDIVTIRYNLLNLPDTIQFKNGNQIVNHYSAGGQKLKTEYFTNKSAVILPVVEGEVIHWSLGYDIATGLRPGDRGYPIDYYATEYIGNLEYLKTYLIGNLSCSLDKIYNSEGYVNGSQYHYYRRDHLGNNREVWLANTNTTVQRTQYYPSGLPWAEGIGAGEQNKKYNGKEFVEMHGYDTYDYGARGMYAAIGRWTAIDPLAEKYYSISPYVYCANNSVKYVDPDGTSTHVNSLGLVVQIIEDGDYGVYVHDDLTGWDNKSNLPNKGDGITKKGETWTELGFADFENTHNEDGSVRIASGARIDFNSEWATEQVDAILDSDPDIVEYALKAKGTGDWDIKFHAPKGNSAYGSLLYGKYASARDAGNFAAGAVAQSSILPNLFFDYGYGVYNQSGNNFYKSSLILGKDMILLKVLPLVGIVNIINTAKNGENKLSKKGIDAGKKFIKNGGHK